MVLEKNLRKKILSKSTIGPGKKILRKNFYPNWALLTLNKFLKKSRLVPGKIFFKRLFLRINFFSFEKDIQKYIKETTNNIWKNLDWSLKKYKKIQGRHLKKFFKKIQWTFVKILDWFLKKIQKKFMVGAWKKYIKKNYERNVKKFTIDLKKSKNSHD